MLTRTPLHLLEADREVEDARRRAAHGDPEAQRAHLRKLARVGRAHEFFDPDLEAFHRAHEDKTNAHKVIKELRRTNTTVKHGADLLTKAENDIHYHGSRLADTAHEFDHPVGRHLKPKRLGNHSDLLHAIQRVSVAPGDFKKEITQGPGDVQAGPTHRIYYGHVMTMRHLRHGLTAHGMTPTGLRASSAVVVHEPKRPE